MGIGETLVNSMTEMVTGSASAIGEGAESLLFETGADGARTLSATGETIITMAGIGLGIGVIGVVFSLLKFR